METCRQSTQNHTTSETPRRASTWRKQPSWKRFEAVFVALRVLGKLVLNEMMLVMMKTMANVRIMEMVMRAAGTRKVLTIVTLLMAVLRGIVTMSLFRQS